VPTTVSLGSNPSSGSVYGQPVTFTATVATSVSSSLTPTGTVQFQVDGANYGTPVTLNGMTASITATVGVGSHMVTAAYVSNSPAFGNSTSGFLSAVVSKSGSMISASASPSSPSFGQLVTLTTQVTAMGPGSGTPTGTVDFYDTSTGTDLGCVALVGGVATLATNKLPLGSNTITLSYGGDGNFLTSSNTVTITVQQADLVLDPTASGALTVSGNGNITVPGMIVVDSSSKTALQASGNASLKASAIQVVGQVQKSGNATLSPTPVTGAAGVPDPLSGLTGPSSTNLTNYGAASIGGNTVKTLNPGIYSQISISGNAKVTLNAGIYLIEGGGFAMSGNASLSGQGILIYNTSSNYPSASGAYGGISLSGNGSINLTAAATGTYAGLVIVQPSANTRALSLSGNATGLIGTLYAPSAQLILSGNAQLNAALLVDKLSISGNGVSTQVADGSASSILDGASAGTLLAGNLDVYVNDPNGYFTANEQARIQDAINAWDVLLTPYSVVITEVNDPTLANVVIDTGTTSAAGSAADGVLGCYNSTGEITILQGWNWYDGADATQIGANQYDFQTVVTHELGHALGLGGNADSTSPMYEVLATGVVRRTPTANDLNIPEPPDGADPERAAMPPVGQPVAGIVMAVGDVHAITVSNQISFGLTNSSFTPNAGRSQALTDGFMLEPGLTARLQVSGQHVKFDQANGRLKGASVAMAHDRLFVDLWRRDLGAEQGAARMSKLRSTGIDFSSAVCSLPHLEALPDAARHQSPVERSGTNLEDCCTGTCSATTASADLAALWMLAAIFLGNRGQTSEERCRRWLLADI
jgi:hypothetical protein